MADWRSRLVAWFRSHGRDLPWRRSPDPYRVWLSEVMLQQTQVDRVKAYYERWLTVLPTLQDVARASLDEILGLWTGLGYYSRARNFHRAARLVMERHGGQVPANEKDLLALPGIGPYTAAAILAFAFNEPYPTLEANTERVYARLFDLADPIKNSSVTRRVRSHLRSLIPEGQARLFNTALMELGSLVCTPTSPGCDECPVAEVCLSRSRGTWAERPVLPRPAPRIRLRGVALVVMAELAGSAKGSPPSILCRRRPATGLWAGFWELPWDLVPDPGREAEAAGELARRLGAKLAFRLGSTSGSFTKYSLSLACYVASVHQSAGTGSGAAATASTVPEPLYPDLWEGPDGPPHALAAHEAHLQAVPLTSLETRPMPAAHRRCLQLLRRRLPEIP